MEKLKEFMIYILKIQYDDNCCFRGEDGDTLTLEGISLSEIEKIDKNKILFNLIILILYFKNFLYYKKIK